MKIVIVEDNSIWRDSLKKMYRLLFVDRRNELSIESYESGAEFIDDIANGKRFDLLSLDLNLGGTHVRNERGNPNLNVPGANGEDILKQIVKIEEAHNKRLCSSIIIISGLIHETKDSASEAFDSDRLNEILINPEILKKHFGERMLFLYKTKESVISQNQQDIAQAVSELGKQLQSNKILKRASSPNRIVLDEERNLVYISFLGKDYEFQLSLAWKYLVELIRLSTVYSEKNFSAEEVYNFSNPMTESAQTNQTVGAVLNENEEIHIETSARYDPVLDKDAIKSVKNEIVKLEKEVADINGLLHEKEEFLVGSENSDPLDLVSEAENINNLRKAQESKEKELGQLKKYLSNSTFAGSSKRFETGNGPNRKSSVKRSINRLFNEMKVDAEKEEIYNHLNIAVVRHTNYAYRPTTDEKLVLLKRDAG